jgi:deazaflavin-dependent oxidoreductase (nitroreductase family)
MQIPAIVKDPAMRAITRAHRTVFDLTDGRLLGGFFGMPTVKLVTTGRRSGQRRETMLTSPARTDDGALVLVASNGGDDRHPAWYLNLVANPQVEVVMRGRRFTASARTATPEERDELWPTIVRTFRTYGLYTRLTDRDIPVVICDPIE